MTKRLRLYILDKEMNQEIDTLLPLKLNIDNESYTTVKDLDNALKCADSKNIRNYTFHKSA